MGIMFESNVRRRRLIWPKTLESRRSGRSSSMWRPILPLGWNGFVNAGARCLKALSSTVRFPSLSMRIRAQ